MLWYFSRLECRDICSHKVQCVWAVRTLEATKLISKSQRWRKTALASLVAALFGLSGSNVSALALGRITVQSALGDPLRAEIDVPDINAEEVASLKTSIALPEAFRAAGLEYNPALAGVQILLQRRADGRAFIRLSGDKPVSEPFVDLILEASWSSGRIVRDYTMLLDPPNLRAPVAVVPALPQVTAAPPAVVAAAAPTPAAPAAPAPRVAAPAPVRKSATAVASKAGKEGGNQITVRPGDTASRIASATKPAQVSLDQMLVALLRANGDAFVNGNLNRLRAGSVLTIPTEEQARSMTASEAKQTVIAQSTDFNDFRSKLANNAPAVPVAAPDRKAAGSIQAQVADKKSAAPAPDKLTLSKGAVQAKAAEEKIAQEKIASDAAKRAAELAKNIKDLGSIGAASVTSPGTVAPVAPAAPVATAVSAAAPALAAPVVAAPAPTASATAAPVPVVTASPVSAPIAPAKPVAPPATVAKAAEKPEPGLIDSLIENWMLIAGGVLVALLAGLGVQKARERKKTADVDSAFLESRLQPDSFFGASGGQRVDTNDGAATGSSMVYSPSQLDAADDVDPVAEADVYLAYGRDLQAEEILKEALRTHSGRIAVHQKLLDIYAKRRDARAFEAMAGEAFKVAGPQSQDWARICEQGLLIDPANPMYQPGGFPAAANQTTPMAAPAVASMAPAASLATQKLDIAPSAPPVSAPMDLDLDLDFSLDEESSSSIVEARPSQIESTVALSAVHTGPAPLDMDFGMATQIMTAPVSAVAAAAAQVELALPDLSRANDTVALMQPGETEDFRQQAEVSFGSTDPAPLQTGQVAQTSPGSLDAPLPELSFGVTAPHPLGTTQAPSSPSEVVDSGMLEFDLGTLSLELDPAADAASTNVTAEPEDPLATKLALAEEFVSIGDDDGARALIEEVIAEASGELKTKAQRALSNLG